MIFCVFYIDAKKEKRKKRKAADYTLDIMESMAS